MVYSPHYELQVMYSHTKLQFEETIGKESLLVIKTEPPLCLKCSLSAGKNAPGSTYNCRLVGR